MYHVYSTMANSNRYVRYTPNSPNGIRNIEHTVLIKGGSGINKMHIGTPIGVHTAVSDEDMDWLKDEFSFKQHIKNGYITVRKQDLNPEVVAAEMVTHDQETDACPVVPQDFKDDDKKETIKPVVNKKSKAA